MRKAVAAVVVVVVGTKSQATRTMMNLKDLSKVLGKFKTKPRLLDW